MIMNDSNHLPPVSGLCESTVISLSCTNIIYCMKGSKMNNFTSLGRRCQWGWGSCIVATRIDVGYNHCTVQRQKP